MTRATQMRSHEERLVLKSAVRVRTHSRVSVSAGRLTPAVLTQRSDARQNNTRESDYVRWIAMTICKFHLAVFIISVQSVLLISRVILYRNKEHSWRRLEYLWCAVSQYRNNYGNSCISISGTLITFSVHSCLTTFYVLICIAQLTYYSHVQIRELNPAINSEVKIFVGRQFCLSAEKSFRVNGQISVHRNSAVNGATCNGI